MPYCSYIYICMIYAPIYYYTMYLQKCHIVLAYYMPSKYSMSKKNPSTMQNSVLPCRTQKHYSFSTGIPAMQVYHLYITCVGTLCHFCRFYSTAYCEVTPTCVSACSIAKSLMHATSQLLGLTCPLLSCNPSI